MFLENDTIVCIPFVRLPTVRDVSISSVFTSTL